MVVIVISKTSFNTIQHNNVSNIAYSSGTVTITSGADTYSYSVDNYAISILFR